MPFSFDSEHPVFLLAHEGNLDALREALSADPDLAKFRASNGSSLLHFASESGHREVVQWLVSESRSNINETDDYGNTALMYASANGHFETVQWLLSEGRSNINDINHNGETALLLAAAKGHHDLLQLLLRNKKITYRALMRVLFQDQRELDTASEALISTKIEDYESCIERASTDIPGFVFQETDSHVLIKDEFYCPISFELIEEPMVAADGVLYDKKHIHKWFYQGHDTSPKTGEKLENTLTLPVLCYKKELEDIHQAIERLYEKKQAQKEALAPPHIILKKSQSLPCEGGSSINESNKVGYNALLHTTVHGDLEFLQSLLANKEISYRALMRTLYQDRFKIDKRAEALISAKIECYELYIERAKNDMPGFVFQVTDRHVLIKDKFFCPISFELIEEPVVAADGVLYNKKHIEQWFNAGNNTSPITGKKLKNTVTIAVLSSQNELKDIHQAIERLYQQKEAQKKSLGSPQVIPQKSQNLPCLSRFFTEASEDDIMNIAGPTSAYSIIS